MFLMYKISTKREYTIAFHKSTVVGTKENDRDMERIQKKNSGLLLTTLLLLQFERQYAFILQENVHLSLS